MHVLWSSLFSAIIIFFGVKFENACLKFSLKLFAYVVATNAASGSVDAAGGVIVAITVWLNVSHINI